MAFLLLLQGNLGIAPRFFFQVPTDRKPFRIYSTRKAVYPKDPLFPGYCSSGAPPKKKQKNDHRSPHVHFSPPFHPTSS